MTNYTMMKHHWLSIALALVYLSSFASAYIPDYMSVFWNTSIKEAMSGFALGDLNGDGAMEVLVSSSAEGVVYAYGYNGAVLWMYGIPGYVNFVKAVDLEGDNKSEVLTGTSGHLYVINSSGELLWKYSTENNNVENAYALDVDGDGVKDILFSTDDATCGSNTLTALSSNTTRQVWTYHAGFHYPNVITSLSVQGKPVILVGMMIAPRSSAGCVPLASKPSRIAALNTSGDVIWMFNTSGGVTAIATGDIDSDDVTEIVLSSYSTVYVLNETGSPKWQSDLEDRVDAVALAGRKDGLKEVLAATYRAYVFNPDGTERYMLNTADRAYSVTAADVNNDGESEYVVGSDKVYVYDSSGGLLWNSSSLMYVGYVMVANLDNLPDFEVAAGAGKKIVTFKPGLRAKVQEADAYYNRAQQLYNTGKYTDALNYAQRADELYRKFSQDSGIQRSRSLMAQINMKINSSYVIGKDADSYYEISRSFYGGGDFINASINAQIARAKYDSIGAKELAAASEEIMNKSRGILQRNASVESYLALDAYTTGDYDNALEHAKTANMVYLFLRNTTAAGNTEELIAQINAVRKPPVSERFDDFLNKPEIRKILYPSDNQAVNMTMWVVYLLILGLLFAGTYSFVYAGYLKLTRKTLDLDKLQTEEDKETVEQEPGLKRFGLIVIAFFISVCVAVAVLFLYLYSRKSG